MRILFDQAVYDMRNKGNVALLQVALERIHAFWPTASLEVLTVSPHLLKYYCPTARPVQPDGGIKWQMDGNRFQYAHKVIPRSVWRLLFELREEKWRLGERKDANTVILPEPVGGIQTKDSSKRNEGTNRVTDGETITDYSKLMEGTDLFVATGAQYMSDACCKDALSVLDRLEAGIDHKIPTVMVGQGVGPIDDPELTHRAKSVLPRVNLIFVRDTTSSPQLLSSFGVDPSHIYITGDDAIEMAYSLRANTIGKEIGVGWRVSHYTEVDDHHLSILRSVLTKFAQKHNAALTPLPISHSAHELDDIYIRHLVAGYSNNWHWWRRFDQPADIIRKVRKCRIVVAGTFHAVVFALAQGIPAVGLAKSEMYLDKFNGLLDQFGSGIQIVNLMDNELPVKLDNAIALTWSSAQSIRPILLEAAQKQIQKGHAAYQQLYQLVEAWN